MDSSRRKFLQNTAVVSLGFIGLNIFITEQLMNAPVTKASPDLGPLFYQQGDVLALPKGFSYKVISRQGDQRGDVVICEDKADPRIIGITPKGKTYVIAKNTGYIKSEFAGPVFSPSGDTLFVNIQTPGLTKHCFFV